MEAREFITFCLFPSNIRSRLHVKPPGIELVVSRTYYIYLFGLSNVLLPPINGLF